MEPLKTLREALRKLPPSGEAGFEGLICQLLAALTGRRFFLTSSGSQRGRDLSTAGFDGTWIAIEAKRFSKGTGFDERELLGELAQLSRLSSRPDLWALAASRPIPEQIATSLKLEGLDRGLEIEILDAPEDAVGDLDLLCASAPTITTQFLTSAEVAPEELGDLWDELRSAPEFEGRLASLRTRFVAPTLGYDHARKEALDWLTKALTSPEEGRAKLGQAVDLKSSSKVFVPRASAYSELDRWWAQWNQQPKPFILLGEEGVGKTWAATSWAIDLAEAASGTIVLFVGSQAISSTDPADLLCASLREITGRRQSEEFWQRRIDAWLERGSETTPAFLLVLDGLNERPRFHWRELFDHFNIEPWARRVALLVTCRPWYWDSIAPRGPEQRPLICELGPFDEAELTQALEAYGRSRAEFPEDLHRLLYVPRYLDLAVKHYQRLAETGDFTVDRLLYEDWKDRLQKKRHLTLKDGEFRETLKKLASEYRGGTQNWNRKQLEESLPRSTPQVEDVWELLTGGLLTIEEGLSDRYTIKRRWLTHALGLLLADQLRREEDGAACDELLNSFLEPHLEIEPEAEILAAAALYALLAEPYPQAARVAILRAWVTIRNHSERSVESLFAYVPTGVGVYLATLEAVTRRTRDDRRARDLLHRALARWREVPKVREALLRWSSRWLGAVHPEGFPRFRGLDDHLESCERLRDAIARRCGGQPIPGSRISLVEELEVIGSDDFPWLTDSALFFLSVLPAESRPPALRRWALSRAIMGHFEEAQPVAWLLRLDATPDFEEAVLASVEPLMHHGSEVAHSAAAKLLDLLGTATALEWKRRLPEKGGARSRLEALHEEDPCKSWLYAWRREDCAPCSEREDLPDSLV